MIRVHTRVLLTHVRIIFSYVSTCGTEYDIVDISGSDKELPVNVTLVEQNCEKERRVTDRHRIMVK